VLQQQESLVYKNRMWHKKQDGLGRIGLNGNLCPHQQHSNRYKNQENPKIE
jgi:hypothetical protein